LIIIFITLSCINATAIIDGLAPCGVTHLEMPLQPEKLWRLIPAGKR
jgi:hypothetical protein